MTKRKTLLLTALAFCAGALAGFALRNSETADYNQEQPVKDFQFDESAYFTDEYLQKAKAKRQARKTAKEKPTVAGEANK